MGNTIRRYGGEMTDIPIDISRGYFDIDSVNGYVLDDKYIPEEILLLILCHVDAKNLLHNCRLTCKSWCNIIDRDVWRIKCMRKYPDLKKINELPRFACYFIYAKDFLNMNLIKNGCGQENLNHWEILSSGGNEWAIEQPPQGVSTEFSKDIPEEVLKSNSCFTTSYHSCTKRQKIELREVGAVPYIMDVIRPKITISEWFAGRGDCKSVYDLKVTLLDENEETIDECEVNKKVGGDYGSFWDKFSHVFDDYPEGVRYVEFYHGGMDAQFWAGHYGSKMTGASVVLSLS